MRNVFDASVNKKSTIECSDFLISILKSPTPQIFSEEEVYGFYYLNTYVKLLHLILVIINITYKYPKNFLYKGS